MAATVTIASLVNFARLAASESSRSVMVSMSREIINGDLGGLGAV